MKKNIAALLLLIATSANAQTAVMFGSPDCGEWVKAQAPAHKAWLMGYLSGLNASVTGNHLDKLSSAEQAFVWMDNFCQKNPLKRVYAGAQALFIELTQK